MSEIKIETLTPIHIGNGSFLQEGNDYLIDDDYIYVLNIDKLCTLIGSDSKSIELWTDAIMNGGVNSFLGNRLKGYQYKDLSKRLIKCIDCLSVFLNFFNYFICFCSFNQFCPSYSN